MMSIDSSNSEHPLLILWKQHQEEINDLSKGVTTRRYVYVSLGRFLEEFEIAVNIASKELQKKYSTIQSDFKELDVSSPEHWFIWFTRAIPKIKTNRSTKPAIIDCSVGLDDYTLMRNFYGKRNPAAHFAYRDWDGMEEGTKQELNRFSRFLDTLLNKSTEFSNALEDALRYQVQSTMFQPSAISIGRWFLNVIVVEKNNAKRRYGADHIQKEEQERLLEVAVEQLENDFELLKPQLDGSDSDKIMTLVQSLHEEYHKQSGYPHILNRLRESFIHVLNSIEDKDKQGRLRQEFDFWQERLRTPKAASAFPDTVVVKIDSRRGELILSDLFYIQRTNASWVPKRVALKAKDKEAIGKEKLVGKLLRLTRPLRVNENEIILVFSCKDLEGVDQDFHALYPWGTLQRKRRSLHQDFYSVLAMVQKSSDSEEDEEDEEDTYFGIRPSILLDKIEKNALLFEYDSMDAIECEFWDASDKRKKIGCAVPIQTDLYDELCINYELEQFLIMTSHPNRLRRLEEILPETQSSSELFRRIKGLNTERSLEKNGYISCVVSCQSWEDPTLEANIKPEST